MQKIFWTFVFLLNSLGQVAAQDGQIMFPPPMDPAMMHQPPVDNSGAMMLLQQAATVEPQPKKQPDYIKVDSTVYKKVENQQIDNPPLEVEGYQRPQKKKVVEEKPREIPQGRVDQISVEYSSFSANYKRTLLKSDDVTNGNPDLEIKDEDTEVKAFPLNFIFKYENANWGTAAYIHLDDNSYLRGLWYARIAESFKLGFSPEFSYTKNVNEIDIMGTNYASSSVKSQELGLNLYAGLELVNDDHSFIELSTLLGIIYEKADAGSNLELVSYGFRIAPSFDVYFKVRPQFHVGFGAMVDLAFGRGEIKEIGNSTNKIEGSMDLIDARIDFLKMKILF